MTETLKTAYYQWPWWKRAWMLTHRPTRRARRLFEGIPPRSYETVMDVGAYDGEFAEGCFQYFGTSRAILIEANPAKYQTLQTKFAAMRGAKVIHAAINDRNQPLTFTVNRHAASSSIRTVSADASQLFGGDFTEETQVQVNGLTLDQLFHQEHLEHVDLMKVDIQGAENLLIAGGQKALKQVDVVVMEALLEPMYEGCALFGELHASMLALGFHLQELMKLRRSTQGFLAYGDAVYVRR